MCAKRCKAKIKIIRNEQMRLCTLAMGTARHVLRAIIKNKGNPAYDVRLLSGKDFVSDNEK